MTLFWCLHFGFQLVNAGWDFSSVKGMKVNDDINLKFQYLILTLSYKKYNQKLKPDEN